MGDAQAFLHEVLPDVVAAFPEHLWNDQGGCRTLE